MTEREIFIAVLHQPTDADREAFLERVCAGDTTLRDRIVALLREHEQLGSFLDRPAAGGERTGAYMPDPNSSGTPPAPREPPGTIIAGRYKLIEEIGEGGMGSVWMAEQIQPIKRLVALKLVKPGMDSRAVLARFEAERQALALMDHPNIAKVLDGGTAQNERPYFVMELVKGIPITNYCDDRHLTVRERLELFAQVCAAVQHAHQKGIIHRDLKPTNVLVTEHDGRPVPKVIDFGLAKALHGGPHALTEKTLYTAFGTVVGTPIYMAPEQVALNALDVDTRADVYALGVLLYELLTGSTPLERKRLADAAWDEIRRLIREEEAPRPSTRLSTAVALPSIAARRHIEPSKLGKLVRGELDWIVMRALEKDRNRRYDTANAFSRDVQRYLADEPVEACPPSALYRVRKFARKHRGGLTAAAGLAVVLLVATGVSLGLAAWANHERRRAEGAERDAEANAEQARDSETTALKARDDLEGALARSLSRPFLENGGGLTTPEIDALWELAANPDQNLWLRFLEEGTRTPLAAAQIRERCEQALVAAVGLDPARRERAEKLLAARLRDPALTPAQKVDIAFAAIDLAAPESPATRLCAETFSHIWANGANNTVQSKWTDLALSRVDRLSPMDAAQFLAQGVTSGDDLHGIAMEFAKTAGRLPPAELANLGLPLAQRIQDVLATEGLAGGRCADWARDLVMVARRLPPSDARRINARAAAHLSEAIARQSEAVKTTGGLYGALLIVANGLPQDEAAQICTPVIQMFAEDLRERRIKPIDIEVFAALASHAPPTFATDKLAEVLAASKESRDRKEIANALVAASGRMPPRDAASILTAMMAKEPDVLSFFAYGLAATTKRLPTNEAAMTCRLATRRVADTMIKGTDYESQVLLAEALAALAAQLPPAEAAEVCGPPARLLADTIDKLLRRQRAYSIESALALAGLTERLPQDEAARLCRPVVHLLTESIKPFAVMNSGLIAVWGYEFPMSLLPLAMRLPANEANSVRASAVRRLSDGLVEFKSKDNLYRDAFAVALAAIAETMPADQAEEACRPVARLLADEQPSSAPLGLVRVVRRLPPAQAAQVLAKVMRGETDTDTRAVLAEGIEEVAFRLGPNEAAELCRGPIRDTRGALARETEAYAINRQLETLARLLPFLTTDEAHTVATDVWRQIASTEVSEPNAFARPHFESLDVLLSEVSPSQIRARTIAIAAAVGQATNGTLPGLASLPAAAEALPCRLSTQELVELLKMPTCYGKVRKVILKHLGNRYNCEFRDHWEFVEYAQKHILNLDFTTPPVRYRAP